MHVVNPQALESLRGKKKKYEKIKNNLRRGKEENEGRGASMSGGGGQPKFLSSHGERK